MEKYFVEIVPISLMALALSMDAFSVSLGIGMLKVNIKQIIKIGIIIGLCHIILPLLGMAVGRFISVQFGRMTVLVGGSLLVILGIQMILFSFSKQSDKVIYPVGFGLLIFAASVSLDSFSVGLSLGMTGLKTIIAILFFGVAAMVMTWIGLIAGRNFQNWLGTYSKIIGGVILLVFGLKVIFQI